MGTYNYYKNRSKTTQQVDKSFIIPKQNMYEDKLKYNLYKISKYSQLLLRPMKCLTVKKQITTNCKKLTRKLTNPRQRTSQG